MHEVAKDCFTVINTAGVHLRPAQLIARLSTSYAECDVSASKDGTTVNAKSIMGITELVGSCGSEIEFEVTGPNANECLNQLRELFNSGFGEEIDARYSTT